MSAPVTALQIYALDVRDDSDVFASRHAGREVATAVGVPGHDLVLVATAISELSRDVLAAGGGSVAFILQPSGMLRFVLTCAAVGGSALPSTSFGLEAARRLLGAVQVGRDDEGRTVITMERQVAAPHVPTSAERTDLERRLSRVDRTSIDELRTQNLELVTTLEEVKSQRDELESTNQGVMALYNELSDELDTTNQGVVALYAEIDDHRRALREASESKTRFLHNNSHELRTPGNSVLGLARLLLDPGAEPLTAEQRYQVDLIRTSAEDLLGLVNQLLDLAKAESGRLDPTLEQVDLPRLFEELRATTAVLVTRPEVCLVVPSPDDVATLRSDGSLLRHVLRNLLSNAVKFTERGQITMSARRDGPRVVITVADSGIGIGPEDQARVFEEFYQVSGELQSQVDGTGLGLPYARRVAGVLGGDLTVASLSGEGSTFTLGLPLDGPARTPERPR